MQRQEREKKRGREREREMGEEREEENIKHILGLRGGVAVHVHKGKLTTSHDTQKEEEEEREGRWWVVEREHVKKRGRKRRVGK